MEPLMKVEQIAWQALASFTAAGLAIFAVYYFLHLAKREEIQP